MTKHEFIDHVNQVLKARADKPVSVFSVSDREYAAIEKVYAFHPAVSEESGKHDIASLYVQWGLSVIMDMLPRAELMADKERERASLRGALTALEDEIERIRRGHSALDLCAAEGEG